MTQMRTSSDTIEDTVLEIARQLRKSLTDSGTITSYLIVASSSTVDDDASLHETFALVRSLGLNPAERIDMLEQALDHERQNLNDDSST